MLPKIALLSRKLLLVGLLTGGAVGCVPLPYYVEVTTRHADVAFSPEMWLLDSSHTRLPAFRFVGMVIRQLEEKYSRVSILEGNEFFDLIPFRSTRTIHDLLDSETQVRMAQEGISYVVLLASDSPKEQLQGVAIGYNVPVICAASNKITARVAVTVFRVGDKELPPPIWVEGEDSEVCVAFVYGVMALPMVWESVAERLSQIIAERIQIETATNSLRIGLLLAE